MTKRSDLIPIERVLVSCLAALVMGRRSGASVTLEARAAKILDHIETMPLEVQVKIADGPLDMIVAAARDYIGLRRLPPPRDGAAVTRAASRLQNALLRYFIARSEVAAQSLGFGLRQSGEVIDAR